MSYTTCQICGLESPLMVKNIHCRCTCPNGHAWFKCEHDKVCFIDRETGVPNGMNYGEKKKSEILPRKV